MIRKNGISRIRYPTKKPSNPPTTAMPFQIACKVTAPM